jgi:hypothetical protein
MNPCNADSNLQRQHGACAHYTEVSGIYSLETAINQSITARRPFCELFNEVVSKEGCKGSNDKND